MLNSKTHKFRFCKISIHYQQYICQIISILIILYCNITMSCIDYSKNEKKEALLNERLPFSLPIMRKMELEPIVPQNKPIIERLLVHFYHNVFNLTNLNCRSFCINKFSILLCIITIYLYCICYKYCGTFTTISIDIRCNVSTT